MVWHFTIGLDVRSIWSGWVKVNTVGAGAAAVTAGTFSYRLGIILVVINIKVKILTYLYNIKLLKAAIMKIPNKNFQTIIRQFPFITTSQFSLSLTLLFYRFTTVVTLLLVGAIRLTWWCFVWLDLKLTNKQCCLIIQEDIATESLSNTCCCLNVQIMFST